ncbi:MAG: TetR/AcrR family transcriptional regulator [Thermoleophilia bacterium]
MPANRQIGETRPKGRDAQRSKRALLGAAEELFAEHGFDGVSVSQIAEAAGLSRGAPNYFFGSKAQLYRSVLEQVFQDREEAIRRAFEPLTAWSRAEDGISIDEALTIAIDGYLDFLFARPTFSKLIQREELASGTRLEGASRESKAIEEAFAAVREVGPRRGLQSFTVDDAVLLVVSLTFYPATQRSTFMASLKRDLTDRPARHHHVRLVVDQVLHLIGAS